jgi:hypothetical protein
MIAEKEIPRTVLANLEAADLETLQSSLRRLQEPYGETFWKLESFIARIEDELQRRAA